MLAAGKLSTPVSNRLNASSLLETNPDRFYFLGVLEFVEIEGDGGFLGGLGDH